MSQEHREVYTYRLPSEHFPVSGVKAVLTKVLENTFKDLTYEEIPDVTELVKKTIIAIKSELESTKTISNRFKYAVQLTISEKIGQAVFSGCMCLWDPEHDNYATYTYENNTLTAMAIVFGCLIE